MDQDAAGAPLSKTGKRTARRGRPPLGEDVHRRRVLDAAMSLFLARGFGGVSLDAVARAAGVTKRTIYELTGDKEGLFRAVCNTSPVSVASLPFPRITSDMGRDEALTALSRTLISHALEPARIALSRMITMESLRFPDLVREVLEVGRDHMNRQICDVFDQMRKHGVADVRDPAFAAELFYDLIVGNQGFRSTIGFTAHQVSDDDLRRRLDVFVRGYIAV